MSNQINKEKKDLFTEIKEEWEKIRAANGGRDLRFACDLDHTRPPSAESEKH